MRRVLILGGTGVVGRAIAGRFARSGWRVDVTGRDPAKMPPELAELGVSFVRADSRDPAELAAACGAGMDLLVDCVCYSAEDARRLLPLASSATSTVMISSKAVYVDDDGNHSNSDEPPRFVEPIRESQPTLPPREDIPFDSREGYGVNKVAAERVLLDSGEPVSVLRPSKIHGPGARPAREWMWVKRALDGRRRIFLAHRGEGGDHTTAATNLAALVETCASVPGARVVNSADPDAPNGLEIARTIARALRSGLGGGAARRPADRQRRSARLGSLPAGRTRYLGGSRARLLPRRRLRGDRGRRGGLARRERRQPTTIRSSRSCSTIAQRTGSLHRVDGRARPRRSRYPLPPR